MLKYLKQLVSESAIYGISSTITRLIQFFLVPVYAHIFSPEDFGVMGLVTTSISLVQIFVVLALDSASYRWFYDTEDTEDRKRTIASWAWAQISLSTLFNLGIFIFSDQLAQSIVGRADAGLYFRISAFTLPLMVLVQVQTNWFRYHRRPVGTMVFSLVTGLLTIGGSILFVVVMRIGLAGIYYAQFISMFVGTAIAVYTMKDWVNPLNFTPQRLRKMLAYSYPLIPASLASWTVNLSSRYFIQFYSTTEEVGLYQFGSYLAMGVALLTNAFQQAWGPFGMSIHKREEARSVYAAAFLGYTFVTSFVSLGLALFAPELVQLLATDDYASASSVVGLLGFTYVFTGLYYIAAIGPSIVKSMKPVGTGLIISAVVNIALNFLLVPRIGKTGSAIATLISQMILPIYVFYRAQQMYPIPYRFGSAAAIFAGALLLLAASPYFQLSSLLLTILLKLVILAGFALLPLLLGIITPGQVRAAVSFLRARLPAASSGKDAA